MTPLRILHLESPNAGGEGDHVYRTRQPCRALAELPDVEVISGSILAPEAHQAMHAADLLVLCDVVDVDLLGVLAARRQEGRPTVYEINDHFQAPQSWNPTAYLAENLLTRSLSSQLAARSDAVQFSVGELAGIFSHLNQQRAVLPNHLWEMPPPRAHAGGGAVWIGWGGSLGHLEDLRWVMPVFRRTLEMHPQACLAVMGPEVFRTLFTWAPAERFRFVPAGPLAAYQRFLDTLDIGVCPLLTTPFNLCRSDVKFLELAAHGVAALCSDLAPYAGTVRAGETGFLFGGLDGLAVLLDRLVVDAGLRARIAEQAYAYVASERQERMQAPVRLAWYRQLFGTASGAARGGSTTADGWPRTEIAETAGADSRHFVLSGGAAADLLYQGLMLARDGDRRGACRVYIEAGRRAPSFYLPFLYRGAIEPHVPQAIAALQEAARLAPGSAATAFALGTRLEEAGDPDAAARMFARAAELAPGLGAARFQLGRLAEQAGRLEEASVHFEAAFVENPYFAPAVLRVATTAAERGDWRAATAVLERAMTCDAHLWLLPFTLGRLLVDAGYPQEARRHLEQALTLAAREPEPVLAQLAKVHLQLGNVEAARHLLAEIRRVTAAA